MDECIKATVNLSLRSHLEEYKNQIKKVIREEAGFPGRMPKTESEIEKESQAEADAYRELLVGEEEMASIEKGFSIAIDELLKENQIDVLSDIKAAADRLLEPGSGEDSDIPVYQTIQEMIGLKMDTFNAIYKIGTRFFDDAKIDEAAHVFTLLTTLNNFIFEPWLGLGCCCRRKEKLPEALRSFSMASLIDFQRPMPHLFSAEVYLKMGDERLARETLDLAMKKMQGPDKEALKQHIEHISKGLQKLKKGGAV